MHRFKEYCMPGACFFLVEWIILYIILLLNLVEYEKSYLQSEGTGCYRPL